MSQYSFQRHAAAMHKKHAAAYQHAGVILSHSAMVLASVLIRADRRAALIVEVMHCNPQAATVQAICWLCHPFTVLTKLVGDTAGSLTHASFICVACTRAPALAVAACTAPPLVGVGKVDEAAHTILPDRQRAVCGWLQI
jgi:hypothetical protein